MAILPVVEPPHVNGLTPLFLSNPPFLLHRAAHTRANMVSQQITRFASSSLFSFPGISLAPVDIQIIDPPGMERQENHRKCLFPARDYDNMPNSRE